MSPLVALHVILVCIWLGLVLAETIIEFSGHQDDDLLKAAQLHYRIDCFLEIPIVLAVLLTGIVLSIQFWPLSRLLGIKIGCAMVAIAVNLYCAVLVILRYRRRDDPKELQRLSRDILKTWLGVPFGLAAFYLGLRLMGVV